jgi:hypothetical protein
MACETNRTRNAHSRIDVPLSPSSSRLTLHFLLGQAPFPSIVDSAATAHQRAGGVASFNEHRKGSFKQLICVLHKSAVVLPDPDARQKLRELSKLLMLGALPA